MCLFVCCGCTQVFQKRFIEPDSHLALYDPVSSDSVLSTPDHSPTASPSGFHPSSLGTDAVHKQQQQQQQRQRQGGNSGLSQPDGLLDVECDTAPLQATQSSQATLPDLESTLGKAEVASFMLATYGVLSLLLCWVFVVLVHAVGVESFEAPPRDKVALLCLNAFLDSLYNGLLLFGILVSTPLIMSVGCMLVMPASIVVDRVVNGTELAPIAVTGAVFIVAAFALLNLSSLRTERERSHSGSPVVK